MVSGNLTTCMASGKQQHVRRPVSAGSMPDAEGKQTEPCLEYEFSAYEFMTALPTSSNGL